MTLEERDKGFLTKVIRIARRLYMDDQDPVDVEEVVRTHDNRRIKLRGRKDIAGSGRNLPT